MHNKNISTVVFDFGGVLVDLQPEVSMAEFFRLGVQDITEMLNPYHQKGLFRELELGLVTPDVFAEKLSEHCHKTISREEIQKAMLLFLKETPLYKWEYLKSLREEKRILLLSNTNYFIMEYAHGNQFLPTGNIDHYIDKIYASNDLHCMKPDREIYLRLMEQEGVRADELLFIDDNRENIQTAHAMGWHTLHTTNETDWRKDLDEILSR